MKLTKKEIIKRLGSGFLLNFFTSLIFYGSLAITILFSSTNRLIFLLTLFAYILNVCESLLLA